MNNKEKGLWEICVREREFCHFLIFRSGWKWYRCEDGYQLRFIDNPQNAEALRHTESCGNETRI